MTSTSKVRLITTYSQFELAMSDSSGVVVVLYTAPGCPHCNNFLPKFNSLSIEREASNVAFYNVNLMSGDGMAIARKNNVTGVPHNQFYSRGRKLGEMRGDSVPEFRKLMVKYQQQHTFSGCGYTLGSRSGGGTAPPTAMGHSREANADVLQRRAEAAAARAPPPAERVNAIMAMGFPRDKAIAALMRTEDNVDQAADILLGGGSAQDKAWMAGCPLEEDSEVANRMRQEEAGGGPRAKCGIGLGLADHWDNTGPRVSDVIPYSPAAEAKVFQRGDKVVSVDGVDVRGKRVEMIKHLILGVPGSPIEIGFIPAQASSGWSLGMWAAGGEQDKNVVRVSLRREMRVQTAAATGGGVAESEAAQKKTAWYSTVGEDIKNGFKRLTKNLEGSLVSAGDSLGEAGSAIGSSAKAGLDSTKEGAGKVADATHKSAAAAQEAITEAGAKVKEAVGVDAEARERMAALEEENRRLKALLAASGGAAGGVEAATVSGGGGRGSVGGLVAGMGGISVTNYAVDDGQAASHGAPPAERRGDEISHELSQASPSQNGAGLDAVGEGLAGAVAGSAGQVAVGRGAGSSDAVPVRSGGWKESGAAAKEKEKSEARTFVADDFATAKSPNVPTCHIRVRLTDGTTMERIFPSKSKLREVMESALATEELRRDWTLMITYPRQVFGDSDFDKTLSEACLVPAATLNVTRKYKG